MSPAFICSATSAQRHASTSERESSDSSRSASFWGENSRGFSTAAGALRSAELRDSTMGLSFNHCLLIAIIMGSLFPPAIILQCIWTDDVFKRSIHIVTLFVLNSGLRIRSSKDFFAKSFQIMTSPPRKWFGSVDRSEENTSVFPHGVTFLTYRVLSTR